MIFFNHKVYIERERETKLVRLFSKIILKLVAELH